MRDRVSIGLLWIILTTGLVWGESPAADEVYLTDGSRLVGRIERLSGGELVLTTDFAGQLKIDAAKIRGLTATRRFNLMLKDGSRTSGIPTFDPAAGQQRLTATAFGDVQVAGDQLVAAWAEGAGEPDEVGLTPEQDQRVAELKAKQQSELEKVAAEHARQVHEVKHPPPPGPHERWTARIEIGLTGKTGNIERAAFRGRAQALRETDLDRLLMYIEGNYARDDGRETSNEIFGGARWERDLTDRWFVFLKTELERDEFELLDLRATVTGGAGYFFIRESTHELKGRLGAGIQHESFQDGTSNNDVILEAGYDYRLDILQWLRFTHSLTYYPVVDDPLHNYRLLMETAGEIPLGEGIWKLRTGMRNDYNAMPRPGIERLDTAYFLNLVAEWK
jgi:putative salt-induced outer membrane protein YdiY